MSWELVQRSEKARQRGTSTVRFARSEEGNYSEYITEAVMRRVREALGHRCYLTRYVDRNAGRLRLQFSTKDAIGSTKITNGNSTTSAAVGRDLLRLERGEALVVPLEPASDDGTIWEGDFPDEIRETLRKGDAA